MKSCGRCIYFARWPGDGGLCEKHDARTKHEYGKKCQDWKGRRYKRQGQPMPRTVRCAQHQDEECSIIACQLEDKA